ncbi:hypothetical protein PSH49_21515 [Pseudoalteromonas sp. GABNS16G]|uniref:hypothetical protein n=1 Tax=unclassified Pseudoalteromonas TaxID=194690 RepID=UPI00235A289E|nr:MULTISPECIES: hypothetical protein [unclassified Pseudoalteromonas]MDC9603160.1 hypothetical protein [Pseudoalteromonas sp. GABNS16G]MDC9611831.1 hypothetical protein [Pseudoalteromonas sp. GABNS16H]
METLNKQEEAFLNVVSSWMQEGDGKNEVYLAGSVAGPIELGTDQTFTRCEELSLSDALIDRLKGMGVEDVRLNAEDTMAALNQSASKNFQGALLSAVAELEAMNDMSMDDEDEDLAPGMH